MFGASISVRFVCKTPANHAKRYGSIRGDLHRVIHTIHNAPVDITVDKEGPLNGEKAQQNQHFESHRLVPGLYRAAKKPLTAMVSANWRRISRYAVIVTLLWNMHRSGAGCSLNVTSIGICLCRQHVRIYRKGANFGAKVLPPLTRPECGTIVKRPLECSLAREPRVFPRGLHESA